jgi:hypothetical protein
MSTFDHIIQVRHQPFFFSRDLDSLKASATSSYWSTVLWIWAGTIFILGVPAAVMALSWLILRI